MNTPTSSFTCHIHLKYHTYEKATWNDNDNGYSILFLKPISEVYEYKNIVIKHMY